MGNPFTTRGMITDLAGFYGRKDVLREVYDFLKNNSMQSCSIVGPRRIGKSSLLYHLSTPAVYQTYLGDIASMYVFAFLNLQELAGSRPEDFFTLAVECLCEASKGRLTADLSKGINQREFKRFLAGAKEKGLRLVLCCDEFEIFSRNPVDVNFFDFLRAMCSGVHEFALVTTSRIPLLELDKQSDFKTSPFWNIFSERHLGLMSETEARDLAEMSFSQAGGTITPDEVNFILGWAGFHPFFIQIACYYLFKSKLSGSQPHYDEIIDLFWGEAYPYYVSAWRHLDKEEQAASKAWVQNGLHPEEYIFRRLYRQTLMMGSAKSPSLASEGWQRFIEEKIASRDDDEAQNAGNFDSGLPSDLWMRLRKTLLRCGQFNSNVALTTLFINSSIRIWRNQLPQANSPLGRVTQLVDVLLDGYNRNGENALLLFLHVLKDEFDEHDALYGDLDSLVNELESVLSKPSEA